MKALGISLVLFFSSCSGVADYGWKLDDSYSETRAKFHAAVALADQAIQQPACRSRLAGLPAWPIGEVPTRWVYGYPDGSHTLLARTLWRNGERYKPIPPHIQIHERVLLDGSTRFSAGVLIHELVHAASWTSFEGLEDVELRDAMIENERLAQEIARECMRSIPTEQQEG